MIQHRSIKTLFNCADLCLLIDPETGSTLNSSFKVLIMSFRGRTFCAELQKLHKMTLMAALTASEGTVIINVFLAAMMKVPLLITLINSHIFCTFLTLIFLTSLIQVFLFAPAFNFLKASSCLVFSFALQCPIRSLLSIKAGILCVGFLVWNHFYVALTFACVDASVFTIHSISALLTWSGANLWLKRSWPWAIH